MRPGPFLALLLGLPQLDAADLPGEGLRKLGDELDLARVGVSRVTLPDVLLDPFDERIVGLDPRAEPDECLHDMPPFGIG